MTASHTASSSSLAREIDGWIIIEEAHTRDREPQYNGDNLSQNQLASSSVDPADVPDLAHEPESLAESTENDDSIDTFTNADAVQEPATPGPFAGLPLTKDALSLSQRQVGAHAHGVAGWLPGAGTSFLPFEPYDDSSMYDTAMMESTMLGSTVSIVSSDDDIPIDPSSSDLHGIGSWAN